MDKIALVSGLNGFVGQHLKTTLEEQHITVVGLPHSLLQTQAALSEFIKQSSPDYIFHLAAYGNNMSNMQEDQDIFKANSQGIFNLLSATKDIPYEAFINVSTSSVLLPYTTIYSATKRGAEGLCQAFATKYDKPIITMRPFSLYGEEDHYNHLIPTIFRSCLYGDEMRLANSPIHDWVYIGDFVKQLVNYALRASDFSNQIINVGTGVGTSNYWLLKEIEQITDKKAHITGSYPERVYDNDNWVARSGLGNVEFVTTKLHDGLQKVYQSYKL